jgi:hypothetical protein
MGIKEAVAEISGRLSFGSPKTHQARTVHLPAFVAEMLGHHLESVERDAQALVFTAPRGGPLRHSNTRKAIWDPHVLGPVKTSQTSLHTTCGTPVHH